MTDAAAQPGARAMTRAELPNGGCTRPRIACSTRDTASAAALIGAHGTPGERGVGCNTASARATTHLANASQTMKRMIPEVKEVVAESE